jgi:comEA protein
MWSLSRQEERFILFFLTLFFVGGVTFLYRKSAVQSTRSDRQAAQQELDRSTRRLAEEVAAIKNDSLQQRVPTMKEKVVSGKININTATSVELQSLSRIGPALAGRILTYRESHGPFKSVDELLQVKGIGKRTLAVFRDRITIQ